MWRKSDKRKPDAYSADSKEKKQAYANMPYGDPALWAQSTLELRDSEDSVELVRIYTVRQGRYIDRKKVRQRMWLHDILDDNKIPYRIEFDGYWATRKKYADIQYILVEEKHGKKARRLIKEYNDTENIVDSNFIDEEEMFNITEFGILQIKCPSCGKGIDFDHHKCPHCKAEL